jgi:hypothetical protein
MVSAPYISVIEMAEPNKMDTYAIGVFNAEQDEQKAAQKQAKALEAAFKSGDISTGVVGVIDDKDAAAFLAVNYQKATVKAVDHIGSTSTLGKFYIKGKGFNEKEIAEEAGKDLAGYVDLVGKATDSFFDDKEAEIKGKGLPKEVMYQMLATLSSGAAKVQPSDSPMKAFGQDAENASAAGYAGLLKFWDVYTNGGKGKKLLEGGISESLSPLVQGAAGASGIEASYKAQKPASGKAKAIAHSLAYGKD